MSAAADAPELRIGHGRLILVVGPSGAGKDTLIAGARAACANDVSIVFPRRVITRASTAAEAHDTISVEEFRQAAALGRFALWWEAHRNCYGIPAAMDDDIRARRTVVCNVSRTIVAAARERYAAVTVVHVTAPPDVLQSRLESRERDSDGDLAARMARSAGVDRSLDADMVIENVAAPDLGIRRLVSVIRAV
ncbi:MAG TPA: phosphonate metabolism protein/1,5-bisphosphokinase (PRPP-forming) PhnN [Xanthobacteraceae bacterium]|nr:phosphonate metabolism protein/1,5-bisphosphokinase (PRPP-forming) PhnN [Xanthobacteraceae bacterium]